MRQSPSPGLVDLPYLKRELELTTEVIFGIDFSGARNAGSKIWIAQGSVEGKKLRISTCQKATEFLGTSNNREIVLPALAEFIASSPNAVFGMDFPFAIPLETMNHLNWIDFVRVFPSAFPTPEIFRNESFRIAGNREWRRQTDQDSHTPMSPYNLRLYRQTFYGISKILNPLVVNGRAAVAPMQDTTVGLPTIVEICPASTLISINIRLRYKGVDEIANENSRVIIERLGSQHGVFMDADLSRRMVEERNCDALDSVIAVFAVFRNRDRLSNVDMSSRHLLEGYVFV